MAPRTYIEKISVKTGEKITISFLQYFITEICSFSENYPKRSQVTADFVKTVLHTLLTKKWKECSMFGSLGSVRLKMCASFVIKKING